MDRRSAVKKYFKTFPKWAVWMIIIGIPLLLAFGLGLLFIGLGIWGLVSYFQRPGDAQIDAWIEDDLKKLQQQALNKTGTDPSVLMQKEPVVVTGLRFGDLPSSTFWAFRTGKDKIFRFTPMDVTVINFTADQLLVYQCALDLTTGNPLNESTDEYFYRDVVSVSTVTESRNVTMANKPIQMKAAETFRLTTSGGTSVEVTISDRDVIRLMGGGDGQIPKTRVEKAIQTVRKMLREKKGGAVPA
jgi:hypothetical protein